MARRPKEFTVEAWRKAGEVLRTMPPKPAEKRTATAKDGLQLIKADIEAAKKNGHTYDDIVAKLKESGIEINQTTFKSYFNGQYRKRRKPETKAEK